MLNGDFSRYYNTYSKIHVLNPLCKILALIIFVIMVLMCSNISVICALSLILVFIITLSNVSFKKYFKPLWGMKVLFIFIILINFLFHVSIYSSFIMICKICLIVLYSSVLLFTTTTNQLAFGFSSLFRPLAIFGFPVSKFSMAIALSINFIPSLFLQSNKILKSQMSRGFNYDKGSFKDRVVAIKSIVIPMFVLSIKRADKVADAMEVKQFNFNCDRSNLKAEGWHFSDVYMLACHLMIFVLVLVKEVVL